MVIVAAVPELLFIVIAVAAVLVAWAAYYLLAKPLGALFRNIPAVGGAIADALENGAAALMNAASGLLEGAVGALTDSIDLISGAFQDWLFLVQRELQWGINTAVDLVHGLADLAHQTAASTFDTLDRVFAVARDVQRALQRTAAVASAFAAALVGAIPRMIDNAVGDLRSWIDGRVGDLRRAILATVAAAIATVAADVSQLGRIFGRAIDGLRADTERAIRDAERAIESDIGRVAEQTGEAIDGLLRDVGELERTIGIVGAGTIVGMIAKVATDVDTMYRECVKPGCDYLGPQLDILNGIMDVAFLAAVAEWVAHAAQHPQEAAQDTVDTWGGVVDDALGILRGVAGVAV